MTYGNCYFQEYTGDFGIECQSQNVVQLNFNEYGQYSIEGECLLFPSKEMRDWEKFAWKKGDILQHSECPFTVIFESFEDDNYTSFKCKYCFDFESNKWLVSNSQCSTKHFYKVSEEEAKDFIRKVEFNYNGKLDCETLEIKKYPEFKDWDFITIKLSKGGSLIGVFKAEDDKKYYLHANLDSRGIITISKDSYCKKSTCIARLSTEEEKQQFFDALAKKGKTWDAVKKQIVDLKSNDKLKPFDKVLVKNAPYGSWEPAFFWKKVYVKDLHPYIIIGGERYRYCEPYEGNEHLLDD